MHADERDVPLDQWHATCAELVGAGATMFDFLTAVDDPALGRIELVAHLVDASARRRHLVRTSVDRSAPVAASLVDVCPGAAWHEREVHELFGVDFDGNADLRPLLTTGDAGFPLRRTTPLPRRVATPWPGSADPADRPPARPDSDVDTETGAAPATAPRTSGRVAARPRSRPAAPGVHPDWLP